MKHELKTIRVYELKPEIKGYRILVDRLWPRGLRKEALEPFLWAKEVAPSNELRKWFGHDPERFDDFKEKYLKELRDNSDAKGLVEKVSEELEDQDVLLLFAAKNKSYNQAIVLKDWLLEKIGEQK